MSWWVGFALTQAIEMPIYLLGMRRSAFPLAWRVGIAFGASALTHPIVWFVLPELLEARWGYWTFVAIAEVFAVVAEALYLRALKIEGAWGLSLVANAASALTGLVLHQL